MPLPRPRRTPATTRLLLACGLAVLLAGCAGTPAPGTGGETAVGAPHYDVGERWVYRVRDGFLQPTVWEETHEVLRSGPDGIEMRVTQRGPKVDSVRVERLAAPGRVRVGAVFDAETRRFEDVLDRYAFPLVPGKTWNQWLRNHNEATGRTGVLNRYVRVGGWEEVTTPAGSFAALRLTIIMHLDDEEFWRDGTECTYVAWYAPAVGAVVREDREAQYFEKSGRFDSGAIRSQHARLELVSHTGGR